jgi:hypothetical protein
MPVTVQRKDKRLSTQPAVGDDPNNIEVKRITVFTYKARWFVLDQTEGAPYIATEIPRWSEERALSVLKIKRVDFTHLDGNCQGFARARQVAVSPIAALPHKTLFHELAHVVLGHTEETALDDDDHTPMNLCEVEAECVALICCESLQLRGIPECRGYIQHWIRRENPSMDAVPHQSAQRIFRAADVILKTGRPTPLPDPAR